MDKLLDSKAGIHGNVQSLLGAKINADRLKAREIYYNIKNLEGNLSKGAMSRSRFADIKTAALFDSYSIVAVNLLGEIWLCGNQSHDSEVQKNDNLRKHINDYIKSMPWMTPVLAWRNKVAAHPAAIDPRSETPADRDISLMPSAVGEENGFLVVPSMVPIKYSRSKEDNRPTLEKWSLTQNWENLLDRFPWLDDDDFIEVGYPVATGEGLIGRFPPGLDLSRIVLEYSSKLPPGASVIVFVGAHDDGKGGLRIWIKKHEDGRIALRLMVNDRVIPPSAVRDGAEVLPDGTIIFDPVPN